MMTNERRANLGYLAVATAGELTNVTEREMAVTVVTDVLAYIAHLCDRLGLDPEETFEAGIYSYTGDFEDGPGARRAVDGVCTPWQDVPLVDPEA